MPVDRRTYPRSEADLACKLLHTRTGRMLAARTLDLSHGGALLEVRMGGLPGVGDRLLVAVDVGGSGVARPGDFAAARVVRCGPNDRCAVSFV